MESFLDIVLLLSKITFRYILFFGLPFGTTLFLMKYFIKKKDDHLLAAFSVIVFFAYLYMIGNIA